MWFLISIACLILGLCGFVYVFGIITSTEREPSTFLKWYVEIISVAVFVLFGFSIFAMINFIFDVVKMFIG